MQGFGGEIQGKETTWKNWVEMGEFMYNEF
jgi:hypothetical protein